jgi:hypothetical protein
VINPPGVIARPILLFESRHKGFRHCACSSRTLWVGLAPAAEIDIAPSGSSAQRSILEIQKTTSATQVNRYDEGILQGHPTSNQDVLALPCRRIACAATQAQTYLLPSSGRSFSAHQAGKPCT